jgi:DNA replication protein DnaC
MGDSVERSTLDLRYEGHRLRDDAREARLLSSIAARGTEEPLEGVDTAEGRFLLNGFKRYRCATKLGISCVPYVSLGENEATGIQSLMRVSTDKALGILEQARFIVDLLTLHGLSVAEVAQTLSRSKAWVSNTSLARLRGTGKHAVIVPEGQLLPRHQPRHRKRDSSQDEKRLRAMGQDVVAYLEYALRSAGIQRHRFLRELFALSRQPKLDRKRIMSLYDSFDYMTKQQNMVWLGPTGCAKTGLATSFLLQAIDRGYRGYFTTFPELIAELFSSLADRCEQKVLRRYQAYDCLLIDEVDYIEVEPAQVGLFFTLIQKRHKQKTTFITSNLGFREWGSFLKNNHLTAALIDRLTENSCCAPRQSP